MKIQQDSLMYFADRIAEVPLKVTAVSGGMIGGAYGITTQEVLKVVVFSILGAIVGSLTNWAFKSIVQRYKNRKK